MTGLTFSVRAIEPERLSRGGPRGNRVLRFDSGCSPGRRIGSRIDPGFDTGRSLMHSETSMTTTRTPDRSSRNRFAAACGLIIFVVIAILPL
jgi:hypothetical protein